MKHLSPTADIIDVIATLKLQPELFDPWSSEIEQASLAWQKWHTRQYPNDLFILTPALINDSTKRFQQQEQPNMSVADPKQRQLQKRLKYLKIDAFPKTLVAFLKLNFYHRDIFIARLQGQTLQEIGAKTALTRERVRQIILITCQRLPLFEDVEPYRQLLSHFDFSSEDFEWLTHQPSLILEYIRLLDGAGEKHPSYEYIIGSNKIDATEKIAYLADHKLLLTSKGNVVPLKGTTIQQDVLSLSGGKLLSKKEFADQINRYVSDNHLSQEYRVDDNHALDAAIHRLPVIWQLHGCFHAYDFSVAQDYLEELNQLFEVSPGIYGINYFFKLDPDLMTLLDIRDGAELANLVSHLTINNFPTVNRIVRQSQVWIGITDPDDFYLDILKSLDGKTMDEATQFLNSEYELHPGTSLSLLMRDYRDYIKDNKIVMSHWEPKNADFMTFYAQAQERLTRPLYSEKEITQVIKSVDPSAELSPILASRLGYLQRGSLFAQKQFTNLSQAIDDLLLNHKEASVSELHGLKSQALYYRVRELENQHQIMLVTPEKYISRTCFDEKYPDSDIPAFLKHVSQQIKTGTYFSWTSLIRSGFSDPLLDLGIDSAFYRQLLASSDLFRTVRTNERIFFKINPTQKEYRPKLSDFIVQAMIQDMMDVKSLLSSIKNNYGVSLTKDKLLEKVNEPGGTVYSPETERVYKNQRILITDSQRF